MRITLFALTFGILGACGGGLEAGSAKFEQCVTNKRGKMERDRAVRRSFRYQPPVTGLSNRRVRSFSHENYLTV